MFVDLSVRKTSRAFQQKSTAKQYQFELGITDKGFKQWAEVFFWDVPCIDSTTESNFGVFAMFTGS